MTTIEASEVAEVFRQALRGEIDVRIQGNESWNEVYCGNVEFMFGGWRITVYNDCGELGYVDSVTAPDGRIADYDSWPYGEEPTWLLTEEELAKMESFLENLEVTP